jgi:hypothetical protein
MAGKVAGIDVHKKVLMVVIIDADTPAAVTLHLNPGISPLCHQSMSGI